MKKQLADRARYISNFLKARSSKLKAGFTLIELLVVIAIIGILASIILASLATAQAKGRDARRISDIKQIQLALELYYDANSKFPITIYENEGSPGTSQLVAQGFISIVPFDSKYANSCTVDGSAGCYSYTALCTAASGPMTPVSYHLGAVLETNNSALATDSDGTAIPAGYSVCTGSAPGTGFSGLSSVTGQSQCGTAAGTPYPGTETCYDVTP
jgi:prepilin-type N-terminal cleavage/methylation domain-containing protein